MRELGRGLRLVFAGIFLVPALVFFGSQDGFAQVYEVRVAIRECGALQCQVQYGRATAVCLGEMHRGHWIFATAGHVVSGGDTVHVLVNGRWYSAAVLFSENNKKVVLKDVHDVALLGVRFEGKLNCMRLAGVQPEGGTASSMVVLRGGKVKKIPTRMLNSYSVLGRNRVGDSGAPVVVNGRLVGIQWGHSVEAGEGGQGRTYLTSVVRLRRVLEVRLRGIPDCGGSNCGSADVVVKRVGLVKPEVVLQEGCGKECSERCRVNASRLEAMKVRFESMEKRLQALEPLLERRLILKTADGETRAERTYKPSDPVVIIGRYRSIGEYRSIDERKKKK